MRFGIGKRRLEPSVKSMPGMGLRVRRMHRAILCLALLSCSEIFGLGVPDEAVPLTPLPAAFENWWTVVEECSGLRADFSDVRWWTVPGHRTIPDAEGAAGQYIEFGHSIVLAENKEKDGFLVRHEILHALLAAYGQSGHPKLFFENRCGGVVSCSGACALEIGGPPPEAVNVQPLDLSKVEISANVVPAIVSRMQLADGCVTILIRATNVGPEAAAMNLAQGPRATWIVEGIGGGTGGWPTPPNQIVLLRPGDARRYAFDCPGPLTDLPPGEYIVRGRLGQVLSAGATFLVLP